MYGEKGEGKENTVVSVGESKRKNLLYSLS